MTEDIKGNPYNDTSFLNPSRATLASAFETRTSNLLALYESALCDTLNDAERLRIENAILERLGIRDV